MGATTATIQAEAKDSYDRATRASAVRLFENPGMFQSAARVLLKADDLSDEEILSRANKIIARENARRWHWSFSLCGLCAATELGMAARMRIADRLKT